MSKEQLDRILRYIELGKREGATLGTGGGRYGEQGYYVQPTVFHDVKDHHAIAREEIFGPVMSIIKWKSLEEVSYRANNTMYGLAAGVWTKDVNKANYFARALKVGWNAGISRGWGRDC